MNKDIVNNKITQSVEHNTQTNKKLIVQAPLYAEVKKQNTWNGKNHKKKHRFVQKR